MTNVPNPRATQLNTPSPRVISQEAAKRNREMKERDQRRRNREGDAPSS